MNKTVWMTLVCAGLVSATAAAAPLATVNGTVIDSEQVEAVIGSNPGIEHNPDARQQILDALVTQEVLLQYAKAKQYEQDADVQKELAMARQQILANAAIAIYLRQNPVTDEELKQQYQEAIKTVKGQEFKARHILVKTEKEANKLLAELKKGADFAKVAKDKSLDQGSAKEGGDLGWFQLNDMVKPFADAVGGAKKGALLGPIQTDFGYHLIQMQEMRDATPPTMDVMHEQLQQELQQKRVKQFIETQKKQANVEYSKAEQAPE